MGVWLFSCFSWHSRVTWHLKHHNYCFWTSDWHRLNWALNCSLINLGSKSCFFVFVFLHLLFILVYSIWLSTIRRMYIYSHVLLFLSKHCLSVCVNHRRFLCFIPYSRKWSIFNLPHFFPQCKFTWKTVKPVERCMREAQWFTFLVRNNWCNPLEPYV